MAAPSAISIRYYLWADDGPWRLPVRLHQDLIARKLALPQYAGTKQKILEVFARRVTRDTYSLKGRGNVLSFDEEGYLDLSAYIEATSMVAEGAEPKRVARNVFDVRFYLISILFLIFDLETIYFFPWCTTISKLTLEGGFFAFFDFIIELLIGYIYLWKTGVLNWE